MKVVLQNLTKIFPSRDKKSNAEVVAVNEWAEIRVMPDMNGHWAYYWLVGAANDHYHEVGLTK